MSRRSGGRGGARRSPARSSAVSAPFDPSTYGTVHLWYRGDDVTLNGGNVSSWNDKSGNARHATQGNASLQPAFTASAINSLPGVTFAQASATYLQMPTLAALAAGELFVVGKIVADPPAVSAKTGFARTGTGTAGSMPFTDSNIYDEFGTSVRKTVGDPTPSLATAFVYNPRSVSGEWTASLNGTDIYTTVTNTVAFNANAYIGYSGGVNYLDGVLCEWILYSAKLTDPNRALVTAALKAYYAVT